MKPKLLLNGYQIDILLHRLACQLLENHLDFSSTVLVGIQPRGTYVLERLLSILKEKYTLERLNYGKLDITFFRDDFGRGETPLTANESKLDVIIEDKNIVFIDDVLHTGRSVRAALTAIESYGRPKSIELLVLIDRRFSRHLPIQPDYIGRQVDSLQKDKVTVNWKEENKKEDVIYLIEGKV